ncbi:MAG: hypothetical protein H6636_09645 [Anaerolineales bacterium]|nr:hypothetical protein [Anaerolineales bacterium]
MKLIIIVPDGMCDWRYAELENQSPVEYAATPGMDRLVAGGQVGIVQTMHVGLPLGSLVGLLGIYGYDPPAYFPLGRSIFEAAALGVTVGPDDLVSRCNIVEVDEAGTLIDFTANQISDTKATAYLQTLALPDGVEIYHDLSYRNVLVYRDWPLNAVDLSLSEPHENVGERVETIFPSYRGQVYQTFVDLMQTSIRPSPRGKFMLWPWGHSRVRAFPPMPYRSFTVTALSFLYGMALSLGGQAVMPPGTTGYLGSDLAAKRRAALEYLDTVDVCVIHCNAPDEEAHLRHVMGKIQALEEIDREVVRPLLETLEARGEPYRIILLADHYTVCRTGRHLPDPIPFTVFGHGITPNHLLTRYSETDILALRPPQMVSHHLISTFLE